MSINALDQRTVKSITTAQVITSVATAVKELVENSIDAGAKSIDVKLVDNGASLIEVSDDGRGIPKSDVPFMALQSYTSKIKDFSDLDSLVTYGFRGEALSSLCKVADVAVVTRTRDDEAAGSYSFTDEGIVANCEICHHCVGTTVRVKTLFKDLPVRRQIMTSSKRSIQEIKSLVRSYAICQPKLRLNVRVNGSNVLTKVATENHRETLACLFGNKFVAQMDFVEKTIPELAIRLTLPRKNPGDLNEAFQAGQHVFVNRRPVAHKDIEKLINKRLVEYFGEKIPGKKKLSFVVSIEVPGADVDVNLEPNKTSVLLINLPKVIETLDELLMDYYEMASNEEPPSSDKISDIDGNAKCHNRKSMEFGEIVDASHEAPSVGPPSSKKRRLDRSEEISAFVPVSGINDHNKENLSSNPDESRKSCVTGPPLDETEETISQLPIVDLGEDFTSDDIARLPNLDGRQVEAILGSTSLNEDVSRDVKNVTLEAWSKGQGPSNLRGGTDVHVYGNCPKSNAEAVEGPETFEAYPGATGCKGFLRFSRETRPLIIQEKPGINFVEVAKALAERWRELSPEERGYYRDLARTSEPSAQLTKPDPSIPSATRSTKVPKVSDETAEKNRKRLVDMLEKMKSGSGKDNNCIRKTVMPCAIDMSLVTREFRARHVNIRTKSRDCLVVGPIDENLWIVRTGTQIWALGLSQLLEGLNVPRPNSIEVLRESIEDLVARWLREKDGMSLLYPVCDHR